MSGSHHEGNGSIDLAAARQLFEQLDQIHVVCLDPEGKQPPKSQLFDFKVDTALAWARVLNERGMNVYWTVNRVRDGFNRKPRKEHITAARFAHVDIDPPKDGSPFNQQVAISALEDFELPPTFIINSGNGLQAFWRLDVEYADWRVVEEINMLLANHFGGDSCHNIDRLMRVPGFVNYPNAKKRAAGRIPKLAGWVA